MDGRDSSPELAKIGLSRRTMDGRSRLYHLVATVAAKPDALASQRESLMNDLIPNDTMTSVLMSMLAKYDAWDGTSSMGNIMNTVVAELCAPERLRAKAQEYRTSMPEGVGPSDTKLTEMLTVGYRRAADIAIMASIQKRVPDPSKVKHTRAVEIREMWPKNAKFSYDDVTKTTPQYYIDEAFAKFRETFTAHMVQARGLRDNALFLLSALEKARKGEDPVVATRLVLRAPTAPTSNNSAAVK